MPGARGVGSWRVERKGRVEVRGSKGECQVVVVGGERNSESSEG